MSEDLAGLSFRSGELHLDTDYVRGRRMKTRVVVRPDGTATLRRLAAGRRRCAGSHASRETMSSQLRL